MDTLLVHFETLLPEELISKILSQIPLQQLIAILSFCIHAFPAHSQLAQATRTEIRNKVRSLSSLYKALLSPYGLHSESFSLMMFSCIEVLNLSCSSLIAIPPQIDALSELVELILFSNEIECVPKTLSSLQNLRLLDLRDNLLETLDYVVFPRNLKCLHLSDNMLQVSALSFISIRAHCPNITHLELEPQREI